MSHLLQAQLFGRYSVQLDQKPVSSINVPRLQVLFAYLLLHHNTPMLRSNLSYRLWPDSNETQARTNLRNLLHLLRQALPDCAHYLHIDNQLIQWLPEIEFDLDVECFELELGQADRFESQEDLNRCRLSLESAVAVYKGELLPDCYADWVIEERERLSQNFMQALERLISPYLVASQAIPVVAIAPLLVIWFGPGLFSKVLVCALIVFFPVLVNTVVGLRAVPQNLRDLMGALRATPAQTLRYLEVPAALPVLLGGLRIGATLSVIGAVVGEFVGSDRGLGFLVNVARGQYDTAMVFVAVITLIVLALALYGVVVLVEKKLLKWNV